MGLATAWTHYRFLKQFSGIIFAPSAIRQCFYPMAKYVSSLRSRLIILVLLAMIPAFGVIFYSAARHRDLTASQVQTNALGAARAIALEHERFFENAHQFLLMLSHAPQIRDNNKPACGNYLAGLLDPIYADFGITDLKGNLLCTALRPGNSLVQAKGPLYNRVVQTHEFSVGEIRTDSSTGKTIVNLSLPLLDATGVLRGVLIAVLDLSWITRLIAENHLPPGATLTLVNNTGAVFIRYPRGKNWIGKSLFGEPLNEALGSHDAEETMESAGSDGVRRLFAFSQLKTPVGGDSVFASIDIPTAVAFEAANHILLHDLTILGLVTALTLAAAWFGADVFVLRRIRDMVATTKELAAGRLSARTRLPYGKSELGLMARAFDELAQTLEQREAEARVTAKQIDEQRKRQTALYELNVAITSTLDVTSVLHTLLDALSALFPSCAATVSWCNKESGALELIAHRNIAATDGAAAELLIEEGLPSIVLKRRSAVMISNAQIDPRVTNPEFFRRNRLFSYLGMPLISKGETLGVLSFFSKEEREFSPEEMDFLSALVNQAAIAIYNSSLYEQTRNQAIELKKSNKIKDEFLGVMSHELRTPLNIIMNYAEALSMGTFGNISPEQERGTVKICSQARHLLHLINGILEITKIESGTVSLHKEALNLFDFMAENRSDYVLPMEKNLTFAWEFPPDLPIIMTDRTKLKQILTNLVDNAIKFTDHGQVTVAMQVLDEGRTLEIKVSDTGCGIPDEMLPLIFDKFRQIDGTTTRDHSGAGLGLYIVKRFVELLEGTITVESRVGEGSAFIVHMPITGENGMARSGPCSTPYAAGAS
jgi:signal transduction histidine kinase/HAMP domain-containing protein